MIIVTSHFAPLEGHLKNHLQGPMAHRIHVYGI